MNPLVFCKNQIPLVADGAMGTYFTQKTGLPLSECERSNLTRPEIIRSIHEEYVKAGARILRTNTFSANTKELGAPLEQVLDVVRAGYRLAKEAAGSQAAVAADMTARYPEGDEEADPLPEYLAIADAFLKEGAGLFLFETLPELSCFDQVARFIKEKKPDCSIWISFTVSPEGITRTGLPLMQVMKSVVPVKELFDGVGLNCGCGPTHMVKFSGELMNFSRESLGLPVWIMPNAGYPAMEESRMIFDTSPDYFAQKMEQIAQLGVSVIGGCCGTTPSHIKKLNQVESKEKPNLTAEVSATPAAKESPKTEHRPSRFIEKLRAGQFVTAAELDPPYGSNTEKVLMAARELKNAGIDVITISDSPMARVKLDSIICAAKIQRETGMEVLPHLCCRDRNVNALQASLFGAQCEHIRAVLAVTGDHVPELDRGFVKPVFNVTSTKLMEMIRQLNQELFEGTPFAVGGAFNPGARNPGAELSRLEKKMQAGAEFFLTQPVFDESHMDCVEKARKAGAKILVGIMPLVSYRNAAYMNHEVPGVQIPEEYLKRFSPEMSREEGQETGIEIALEIARKVRKYADGFYFMTPFNRAHVVARLMKNLF